MRLMRLMRLVLCVCVFVAVVPALADMAGDFDEDGDVDEADLSFFAAQWRCFVAGEAWDQRADLQPDSVLNQADADRMIEAWLTPRSAGTGTVTGYVGVAADTAQSQEQRVLILTASPPAEPVWRALVKLRTPAGTITRHTLPGGSFAASVAAGPVTVTAHPPEDQKGDYVVSAPSSFTAAAGKVTLVGGQVAGPTPTVPLDEFMPLNVGDLRAMDGHGWIEGEGSWDEPYDWQSLVVGTVELRGQPVPLSLDPFGWPRAVGAMATNPVEIAAGWLMRDEAPGTISLQGLARVVRNPNGTHSLQVNVLDKPMIVPPMPLGAEQRHFSTAHVESPSPTLLSGLSLGDLDAYESYAREVGPLPSAYGLTLVLSGRVVPVQTPAGDFLDTASVGFIEEWTSGGDLYVREQHTVLARGVGPVAGMGQTVRRALGAPPEEGVLVERYEQWLRYARVGGTEHGAAPVTMAAYWPMMRPGAQWTLRDVNTSETSRMVITGLVTVDGQETWALQVQSGDGTPLENDLFRAVDGGIQIVGVVPLSPPNTFEAKYVPPELWPDGQIGTVHEATVSMRTWAGAAKGSETYRVRYLGFEDVTVPAGTFLHCLKMDWQETRTPGDTQTHTFWLARGAGIVKHRYQNFTTGRNRHEELVSYPVPAAASR